MSAAAPCGKKMELYELYCRCFPQYPVTEKLFCELLQPEKAHIIVKYEGNRLVGFAMVHGNSVSLLCVEEAFRRRGIGSTLLREAEAHISQLGAERIRLGSGRYYLLQGVPTENEEVVPFFKKRGYTARWCSTNMELPLADFSVEALDIPAADENVEYRMLRPEEKDSLFEAIEDAKDAWKNVYETCVDPIFVAVKNGKVVGFEVLAPTGGRFVRPGEKVGCVGCVGVVHGERQRGIGRRMVAEGIAWLKGQGCTSIELRFVEIVNWYKRMGFLETHTQWMGEKPLL